MIEIVGSIVNKLFLRISSNSRAESEVSTASIVRNILYNRVSETFRFHPDWQTFMNGGQFSAGDDIKAQSALHQGGKDTLLWALNIKVKDSSISRRRWIYQIGIRTLPGNSVILHYVKQCYDHMAGSISIPKPIPLSRDPFPDALLFDKHLRCMCGRFQITCGAQELNKETLPRFVSMVQDQTRMQPIMLITCTWYLSPEILSDLLAGNMEVFWCEDAEIVMRLNKIFPSKMHTKWETVRIFMPVTREGVFHPSYTIEDIHRMGENDFVAGLLQAYCQSLRSEEQRTFITVSEVQRAQNLALIHELRDQSAEQEIALLKLKEHCKELEQEKETALVRAEALKEPAEAREYESLLNDSMAEVDALKAGISAMSTRLYSCMGVDFKPDENEPIAVLGELAHAIYVCLACANSKK